MHIGIDAHALGTRAGGNESYMRNLLHALATHPDPDINVTAFVQPAYDGDECATFNTVPLAVRSSYLRVPFALPYSAHRAKVDLLHVQYTAPPFGVCPYIVSMHDAVALRLPESMPLLDRYRLRAFGPRTLHRAARVFTLTAAIRDELHAAYGVPLDKFDVVSPAPDPIYRPVGDAALLDEVRKRYNINGEYILYVGLLQPRKNLVRLAEAFSRLRAQGFSHELVIVGRRAWLYREMLDTIDRLNLDDRLRFTGYVPLEDLPALYSGASVFAYPSLYEGFGIPVLEALACGAPVLTSTDPALAEVAGDAALLADPMQTGAIAEGLTRLLGDAALRKKLRAAGFRRAAQYTLAQMAESAWTGYRRALE